MAKKRRKFSPQFKAEVVLEVLSGSRSQAEICRMHDLSPNLLALWKAAFLERAPSLFEPDTPRRDERAERIDELERVLGRMTLENELLKKASSRLASHSSKNGTC